MRERREESKHGRESKGNGVKPGRDGATEQSHTWARAPFAAIGQCRAGAGEGGRHPAESFRTRPISVEQTTQFQEPGLLALPPTSVRPIRASCTA